ncbi:nucleolin [Fasciola gigantica]|uniref:Nucleolin n=1 Tax=Fasciola gigantica TaxID=46835 RepID=A0A504YUL6_FASGI|nr:nucleolin [Fasciola gigantica]
MQMAKEMLATKLLDGKILRVQVSSLSAREKTDWRAPTERQMSDFDWNVLYVSQLARSTTRFDLAQVFRKASSIRFPTYDDGSSKGVCWLTYHSTQDALQAFETRHGTFIRGSPIYINFALNQKPKPQEPIPELPEEPELEFVVTARKRTNPDSGESDSESEHKAAPLAKSARMDRGDTSTGRPKLKATDQIPKSSTKLMVNNKRDNSHPKLLNKHQLRKKGGSGHSKNTTLTALETLLRPADTKPKHGKKSKKVTKRGKPSKHR